MSKSVSPQGPSNPAPDEAAEGFDWNEEPAHVWSIEEAEDLTVTTNAFTPLEDGMAELTLVASASEVMTVFNVADAIAKQTRSDGPKQGEPGWVSIDALHSDALVALITQGAAIVKPPAVHVTVDLPTLLGLQDNPAELAGYGPIPAELARILATDGRWRRMILEPQTGELLDLGHSSYKRSAELSRLRQNPRPYLHLPVLPNARPTMATSTISSPLSRVTRRAAAPIGRTCIPPANTITSSNTKAAGPCTPTRRPAGAAGKAPPATPTTSNPSTTAANPPPMKPLNGLRLLTFRGLTFQTSPRSSQRSAGGCPRRGSGLRGAAAGSSFARSASESPRASPPRRCGTLGTSHRAPAPPRRNLFIRNDFDAAAQVDRLQLGPALALLDEERGPGIAANPLDFLGAGGRPDADGPVQRHEPDRQRNGRTVGPQGREDPRVGTIEKAPSFIGRKSKPHPVSLSRLVHRDERAQPVFERHRPARRIAVRPVPAGRIQPGHEEPVDLFQGRDRTGVRLVLDVGRNVAEQPTGHRSRDAALAIDLGTDDGKLIDAAGQPAGQPCGVTGAASRAVRSRASASSQRRPSAGELRSIDRVRHALIVPGSRRSPVVGRVGCPDRLRQLRVFGRDAAMLASIRTGRASASEIAAANSVMTAESRSSSAGSKSTSTSMTGRGAGPAGRVTALHIAVTSGLRSATTRLLPTTWSNSDSGALV